VTGERGHCQSLVCRYHGWAYGRDGSLLSARDFGGDVDAGALGLFDVAVASWRGLVFVNLDAQARPLVNELAAFFAAAASEPFDDFAYSHRVVHTVECNWKTYAENYAEGYHVPLVHPDLNREIDAKRYRVDVGDYYCEHTAPTRDGAVNSGRWLWRFPNLALNVYPDAMNVERFVPDGPHLTHVVYDYFFATACPAERREDLERVGRDLLDEDRTICEAVQRNLDAGVYTSGPLSPRHENGVAAFQEWLRGAVEA
jgi:choline monooxygenase